MNSASVWSSPMDARRWIISPLGRTECVVQHFVCSQVWIASVHGPKRTNWNSIQPNVGNACLFCNKEILMMTCLEVNKCAFTFSSEIRQNQCTRTELDKHQIQASALDLSYFTRKNKCKFINLIHTRQKNKIICSSS